MTGGKRSFFQSGAFKRLLFSYIIVIVLLAVVFSFFMTLRTYDSMWTEARNSQFNRLARIAERHGEYLTAMQNTADQMSISPFIKAFVFQEHPDMAYQLMKYLSLYAATNTFCERMFLCFAIDSHIYSSQNSMTLDALTSLTHFEHFSASQLESVLHGSEELTILPAQRVQGTLLDGSSEPIITYFMPFGMLREERGCLMFLVRKTVFDEMFSDAIATKNNTYIFYRDRTLVSSCSYSIPDEEIRSAMVSGLDAFRFQGDEYILSRVTVPGWSMEYVSLIRSGDLAASLAANLSGGLIILAVGSLLAFFIAYRLARRNWQPVHEISSLLSSEEKQGDEWQKIKQGISELSRQNAALSIQLENALPMRRHDFVLSFLKNHYPTRQDALQAAAGVELKIDRKYYAVVLCFDQEAGRQPMVFAGGDCPIPGVCACGTELVALDAILYLVFADSQEALVSMAEEIHRRTQEQSGQAVTTISGIHEDFSEVSSAYLEAAATYDNRFVMDADKPLFYGSIPTNFGEILPQAQRITEGIHQALLLRSEDLLNSKIAELLHFLKRNSMSSFSFRLIYNNVIETLLKEHMDALSRERGAQEVYDILMLSGCASMDDVSELLRRLCHFILSCGEGSAPAEPDEASGDLMDRVVGYIDTHYYDKELSISAIAETFNMPNARLSQLFKSKMRVTPLEYLTMLRVEHSKDLLVNSDLSVKEIAEAVGYYDAGSFIRRFRQKVGMTPMQFKRSKEEPGSDVSPEG